MESCDEACIITEQCCQAVSLVLYPRDMKLHNGMKWHLYEYPI